MASRSYKGTEYSSILRNLRKTERSEITKEKCPKCSTEVSSYYTLLTHIESFHPNDVKHKLILQSSTQQQKLPNIDVFESFEFLREETTLPTFEEPATDSRILNAIKNNPFFKVIDFCSF